MECTLEGCAFSSYFPSHAASWTLLLLGFLAPSSNSAGRLSRACCHAGMLWMLLQHLIPLCQHLMYNVRSTPGHTTQSAHTYTGTKGATLPGWQSNQSARGCRHDPRPSWAGNDNPLLGRSPHCCRRWQLHCSRRLLLLAGTRRLHTPVVCLHCSEDVGVSVAALTGG
jgi:hypothetical protein